MVNSLVKKIIKGTATLFLTGSFLLQGNLYSSPTVPQINDILNQYEKKSSGKKLIISGVHIPERFRDYKTGKPVDHKEFFKFKISFKGFEYGHGMHVKSFDYDTDNNGERDTTVFRRVVNGKLKEPFMYLFDRNGNGIYEYRKNEILLDVNEGGLENGNGVWMRVRKNTQ